MFSFLHILLFMNKAQVLLQFSFKSRGKMLDGDIYLKSENNEKENVRELLIKHVVPKKTCKDSTQWVFFPYVLFGV